MCDEVFSRIDQLMRSQNKKNQELNEYLGVSRTTYDNWRRGRSRSYSKYIDQIAEYFDVSSSYIRYGRNIPPKTYEQQQEDELIKLFRQLQPKYRDGILAMLNTIVTH